ncbi:MAG: 50S ribosomal protein L19 [Mycoplasma sp.]
MNLNRQKILSDIQSSQLKADVPNFSSGDTVVVHTKISENNKTRIQKFEGVVLRRRGSGLGETFTVRKESNGVWLEETFQVNSPLVTTIELKRKGKVRRAYISYMRQRSGKSARIKQG